MKKALIALSVSLVLTACTGTTPDITNLELNDYQEISKKKYDVALLVGIGPKGDEGKTCPYFVVSPTDSCEKGKADPLDSACRGKDKTVVWVPAPKLNDIILENAVVTGPPGTKIKLDCDEFEYGALKCKIKGAKIGDIFEYNIVVTDTTSNKSCDKDPTIKIDH